MLLTIVSFILVMGVVVFIHELGHLIAAKRNRIIVDEFGLGYPPRLFKVMERGGTVYTINAIPFGGFARMRGEDDPTEPGSFAAASRGARFVTLAAGPAMNFLLAFVLFAILSLVQGMPDASKPGAIIQGLVPGAPAEQAGLVVGDRVIAADGQAINTVQDLQTYTSANLGKAIVYTVVRADGQTVELTATPRQNPPENEGALGIRIGQALRPTQVHEALGAGARSLGTIVYMTFAIPANLIREGRPISEAGFMGPVGIAATTGQFVRMGISTDSLVPTLLYFVAVISAALGLTNLLPIPALDGGRILFLIIETIRGRRIEPAREGMVHLIGFGLLLLLVGLLTVREVSSLINGTFPTIGAP
ncbi:MAG: M50 family metallopeptidase [Anaerolineae bacterium]|jgi:regulator of sigma E protease|nr:M50 family metallopeptidase [Anaerolineae bacterium]